MASGAQYKKSKLQVFLLVGLLFVVVGAVGAVAYLISRHSDQLEHYSEAMEAYESEDWMLAEARLAEALLADPNNEEIVTKLAEVNERLSSWMEAGFLWSRSVALNAFKREYVERMLEAYARAGRADLLRGELMKREPLESDRQRLLLAFANIQVEELQAAREVYSNMGADVKSSPMGELVGVYLSAETPATAETIRTLEELASSTDPVVQLYALHLLANQSIEAGEMGTAEVYLKRRIPLNEIWAKRSLANFYYIQGRLLDAAERYREEVEYLSPLEAIRFAECLTGLEAMDEVRELAKRFRVGRRADLLAGYYMDALVAFEARDLDQLSLKLEALGDELPKTPLAELLALSSAADKEDVDAVVAQLKQLPFDGNKRLATFVGILEPMMQRLITANDFQSASRIATSLELRNYQSETTAVAILGSAAQKRLLRRDDLEKALKQYPEDPAILSIAADFYLRTEDYAAAEQSARALIQLEPQSISAQLQWIGALESMARLDEARLAFRSLIEIFAGNERALITYLSFCTRYKFENDLAWLNQTLRGSPDWSEESLVLTEAELSILRGKHAAAYSLLLKMVEDPGLTVSSRNASILYRSANLLASGDHWEPAIAVYQKLLQVSPESILILSNLSELYTTAWGQTGDEAFRRDALGAARKAYEVDMQSIIGREAYGLRLFEIEDYQQAEPLLYELVRDNQGSLRVTDAWRVCMEQMITDLEGENAHDECSRLCRRLLSVLPENPVAKKVLLKIASTVSQID